MKSTQFLRLGRLARALAGGDGVTAAKPVDRGNGRADDGTDSLPKAFSDVSDSDSLCPDVDSLWSKGVINGDPEGADGIGTLVSRDSMAKFLVHAFALAPF